MFIFALNFVSIIYNSNLLRPTLEIERILEQMLPFAFANPLRAELREKIEKNASLCDVLTDPGFVDAFRQCVSTVVD